MRLNEYMRAKKVLLIGFHDSTSMLLIKIRMHKTLNIFNNNDPNFIKILIKFASAVKECLKYSELLD